MEITAADVGKKFCCWYFARISGLCQDEKKINKKIKKNATPDLKNDLKNDLKMTLKNDLTNDH